jgi:hypothetical protein
LEHTDEGRIRVDDLAYHIACDGVKVLLMIFLMCLSGVESRIYRRGEIGGDDAINQMVQRSAV